MSRSERKWEHVLQALATGESGNQGFRDVHFLPNSLPNISYGNISLAAKLHHLTLSSPVLINAMTGGSPKTAEVNRKLATLAREKGLAMAVGSQMAALKEPSLADSYRVVRQVNPRGIVFANLGGEATVEQAIQAVEMLEADALQIHLNVMQELLMPEGDRDFTGYLEHIRQIAEAVSVPVIVKEVGFGMARESIRQLIDAGIRMIDLGGSGGTNFAAIENRRSPRPLSMFEQWGLSTLQSLLEAGTCARPGVFFIASGGIRNGLDACKAIALGASAVGVAGFFLQMVQTQPLAACMEAVDLFHHQMKVAMTALGTRRLEELRLRPLTISGETALWAWMRGIDCRQYARRGDDVIGAL